MVDMISGGRLILGLGAGYAPEEFSAFEISIKERGSRLEEGASLLHRLWTEEHVSHEGRHYRVTDVTLGPRPMQQPRPPIWFAGWVELAIRRAARLGDARVGGPSAKLDELAACVRIFQEARQEAKQGTHSPDIALMRYVFVADSLAQAYATVGDATLRIFETTYIQWPHPMVKRPPGTLTIQRLAEERFILGTPAQCIEQIERFRQRLGLTHLICRLSFPGVPREASLASMERFTREVMPALRQAHTS
jgi:alkanesulfonate monooxygenase SsuD/methylene tetrahydromethanopterin reductase-like flavin-dependent oxidoreductase (luciferase family)